jgi:hypothetical protein
MTTPVAGRCHDRAARDATKHTVCLAWTSARWHGAGTTRAVATFVPSPMRSGDVSPDSAASIAIRVPPDDERFICACRRFARPQSIVFAEDASPSVRSLKHRAPTAQPRCVWQQRARSEHLRSTLPVLHQRAATAPNP